MKGNGKQCKAMLSNGSRRCEKWAIAGADVCAKHGGAAPQVRDAARRRLLEAADPAAAKLAELVGDPDPKVSLAAAKAILDRSGYPSGLCIDLDAEQHHVHHGLPMEQALGLMRPELRRELLQALTGEVFGAAEVEHHDEHQGEAGNGHTVRCRIARLPKLGHSTATPAAIPEAGDLSPDELEI